MVQKEWHDRPSEMPRKHDSSQTQEEGQVVLNELTHAVYSCRLAA